MFKTNGLINLFILTLRSSDTAQKHERILNMFGKKILRVTMKGIAEEGTMNCIVEYEKCVLIERLRLLWSYGTSFSRRVLETAPPSVYPLG